MVIYPIPESAVASNLKAWLESRHEAFLSGWTISTIWQTTTLPDRLIVVGPGNAADRQVADLGMVTITILGPASDYDSTLQAAQYIKAALPTLTGRGIASLSRVNGPTAASDASGRPKRILTANFTTLGASL